MLVNFLALALGLLLVAKGGDFFVDSSVQIARAFGIPRLVIGGTLVSLATTLPEFTVSTLASFMGDSGIALGNAVGSVICNIGLVAGIAACLREVRVDLPEFRSRSLWMIASALVVILFSWDLYLSRLQASLLLFLSVLYLLADYWNHKKRRGRQEIGARPDDVSGMPLKRAYLLFSAGALMVITGSRFLVQSGSAVAAALGVPSVVIGLTVIAVGTSLPELITAVVSVRKGVSDLSIGNIIGANILNLSMITGTAALIHPLTLTRGTQAYSFSWMIVFIFGMVAMMGKNGIIDRREGSLFLGLYFFYVLGLFFLRAG